MSQRSQTIIYQKILHLQVISIAHSFGENKITKTTIPRPCSFRRAYISPKRRRQPSCSRSFRPSMYKTTFAPSLLILPSPSVHLCIPSLRKLVKAAPNPLASVSQSVLRSCHSKACSRKGSYIEIWSERALFKLGFKLLPDAWIIDNSSNFML